MISIITSPFRLGTYAIKFSSKRGEHFYHFPTIEQAQSAINKLEKNEEILTEEEYHSNFLKLCGDDYYSLMWESGLTSSGTQLSSSNAGS